MHIVAEKREARWTYKGERGYMPRVGRLAENGLVVGHESREGNAAPQAGNREFIEACAAEMPRGKRIARARSDGAGRQAAIFNWCEAHGATFAVGADLDAAVDAAIGSIPAGDWRPCRDGWIARTVHGMNETRKAFRLVVVRRPVQGRLFEDEAPGERCKAIAGNRDETAEETAAWYSRRGEASENRIKELKTGFGMERMPCGGFGANAAFFGIGVLAYNLFVVFKRDVLPADWRRRRVQTPRRRPCQTAGKVVHHAGALVLKARRSALALLEEIRARSLELARAWARAAGNGGDPGRPRGGPVENRAWNPPHGRNRPPATRDRDREGPLPGPNRSRDRKPGPPPKSIADLGSGALPGRRADWYRSRVMNLGGHHE
jgi:hypothetical protein